MSDTPQPIIRRRENDNLHDLNWQVRPTARQALIDKARIRVSGSIQFSDATYLDAWFNQLTDWGMERRRFFLNGSRRSDRKWQILTANSGWTVKGELVVYPIRYPTGRAANWQFTLDVNPTRTLAHLLSQYPYAELTNIHFLDFFSANPALEGAGPSLDQSDNMIMARHLPDTNQGQEQFFDDYLTTYELALQQFVWGMVNVGSSLQAPTLEEGRLVGSENAMVETPVGRAEFARRLRIDWGGTTLQQCEVYWERRVPHAISWMRGFADQTLGAARDVRIRRYDTDGAPMVERDAGSLVVTIPLDAGRGDRRSEKTLVVYAKHDHRVRFEIRYHADLPDAISNGATCGLDRLSTLFRSARLDAERRLPWDRLALVMREIQPTPAAELIPMIELVRSATEGQPSAFRRVLDALLLTGGITESGNDTWASPAIIRQLLQAGVVEQVTLIRHQRGGARRFRLAQTYQGLLAIFRTPV